MSKTKESIPPFAWHVVSREAVLAGWDFEVPMEEVIKKVIAEQGDHMMFAAKSGQSTYLSDWLEASAGRYTSNFLRFFQDVRDNLARQVEEGKQWPDVILVSSHSGSSDYFTKEMLFSLLEEVPTP